MYEDKKKNFLSKFYDARSHVHVDTTRARDFFHKNLAYAYRDR